MNSSRKFWFRDWIIKLILGVKPECKNFEWTGLIPSIMVIVSTYFIIGYFNFFEIVDSMIELSTQPWYMGISAKVSFLLIPVRIISLSLFTKLNHMIERYVAAFITQLVGFIGAIIINFILNDLIRLATNIELSLQIIYGLLPYAVTLVVILTMNYIYRKENFRLRDFLRHRK